MWLGGTGDRAGQVRVEDDMVCQGGKGMRDGFALFLTHSKRGCVCVWMWVVHTGHPVGTSSPAQVGKGSKESLKREREGEEEEEGGLVTANSIPLLHQFRARKSPSWS